MEVIEITLDNSNTVADDFSCDLAIGMFDGVHLGHQKVIDQTISLAADSPAKSAILTLILTQGW